MAKKERFQKLHDLGCIVCRLYLGVYTEPCIHHIRDGMGMSQRNTDENTIPLCPNHHQYADGTSKYRREVAYHKSPKEFENKYGTEKELLNRINDMIT